MGEEAKGAMIGVTIGIGKGWRDVATVAARQMQKHTGVECHVIEEIPVGVSVSHPSWLKLHVFDLFLGENEILFFDADVLCIRNWDTNERWFSQEPDEEQAAKGILRIDFDNGDDRFRICNDEHSLAVENECKNFGIEGPWQYFNAGLWIAQRHHDEILKRAAARGPVFGSWLEQTALVTELQNENVNVMPRELNRLLWPGFHSYRDLFKMPDINLHLASIGNPEIIMQIFKANGL